MKNVKSIDLYVDIIGDDIEHADHLESTVSLLLRGMALARRGGYEAAQGIWPGCASLSTVSRDGRVRRISVRYEPVSWAESDGRTLGEFLLANGWGEYVVGVFLIYNDNDGNTFPLNLLPGRSVLTLSELSELS